MPGSRSCGAVTAASRAGRPARARSPGTRGAYCRCGSAGARGLQRALLPAAAPRSPHLRIAERYRPATAGLDIAGDWYDVTERRDEQVMPVIGDVEGHGSTAAVVLGRLRSAVRACTAEGHGPGAVLARTNELMIGLDTGRFATCLGLCLCLCLCLDPANGAARMASAGHPLPLIRRPDGGCLGPPVDTGPPLGVVHAAEYPTQAFRIEPDSLLALFTDGINPPGGLRRDGLERGPAGGGGPSALADRLLGGGGARRAALAPEAPGSGPPATPVTTPPRSWSCSAARPPPAPPDRRRPGRQARKRPGSSTTATG